MARRGRFGRVPRAAPSLTNTIIAIAREMLAAEDRNIMDAWQNGGMYQGSPVTDDMVLAHWQGRLKDIAKDDPLYDQYNNTYMQLDYSIHESKQSMLYAQGKISAQQMGQFYLNWAKKVPKDSEFYRQLQRDGARFLQSAAASGRSGRAASKRSAYDAAQATAAKGAEAGVRTQWVLKGLATTNSLLDIDPKTGAPKSLGELSDPAQLMHVLDQMNAHPEDPVFSVGGVNWTGNDVYAYLSQADPNFRPSEARQSPGGVPFRVGGLTTDYILRSQQVAHATLLNMATRAQAYGTDKAGVTRYTKMAGEVTEAVRDINLWGPAASYNMIIATRDSVLDDPTATNVEKKNALDTAAQALAGLASVPGLDMRSRETLFNEANANAGVDVGDKVSTFSQDYLGTHVPSGVENTAVAGGDQGPEKGSNVRVSNLAAQLNGELDELAKNPWSNQTQSGFMTTFGTRDPVTGVFKFDPKGTEIGVVDGVDVARSGLPAGVVAIPQAGASPLMVYAIGHKVYSQAIDPRTGNEIPAGVRAASGPSDRGPVANDVTPISRPTLGIVYTYNIGQDVVRLYQTPDGLITSVPPWAAGASERDNPDGTITVDVSALVAAGQSFYYQTNAQKLAGDPGTLMYDPQATAVSSIREHAGFNPDFDFRSLLIASMKASPDVEADREALLRDPTFQQALLEQQLGSVTGGTDQEREREFRKIQQQDNEVMAGRTGTADAPSVKAPTPMFFTAATNTVEQQTITNPNYQAGVPGRRPPTGSPTIQVAHQITVPGVPVMPGSSEFGMPVATAGMYASLGEAMAAVLSKPIVPPMATSTAIAPVSQATVLKAPPTPPIPANPFAKVGTVVTPLRPPAPANPFGMVGTVIRPQPLAAPPYKSTGRPGLGGV